MSAACLNRVFRGYPYKRTEIDRTVVAIVVNEVRFVENNNSLVRYLISIIRFLFNNLI